MSAAEPSPIPEKLLKPYNPAETEARLYAWWKEQNYFAPQPSPAGTTFSMVLPPPNVTGTLHTGHAMMVAVEDILARYHRQRGEATLWLPGTDHAAIATQAKVEADLYKKEKLRRQDLGREEFLKRVEAFAQASHDTIVSQIERLGASVDWDREAYTLDAPRELAVRTAFTTMYDAGLIYRGARIVNWDPNLHTTVSDDEVEYVEAKDPLYYLHYGPFTIATARPETKFGDKYVVMHPDDPRYAAYHDGQTIELEWINGPITATIVKDEAIDMNFGTGVMTITPWHDQTDFEIAERHHLAKEQIIDQRGCLLPIAGEFAGLHIKKARPLIVEKLKAKGLVEKTEDNYVHNVATNSRGGGQIEPQVLEQWFVAVNTEFPFPHDTLPGIAKDEPVTLKRLMRHVVETKQIEIVPERFEKIYYHWIDNLRDWCISRQIWYGHQVPVWTRGTETFVGTTAPNGEGWQQDPDTLDTWFSSGLWTFSTLGWPTKTADLSNYHPTDVLETGYDILFFWVARMILMTTFLLGTVPFRTVYLHGLVRDEHGRKMSKSLGNQIDPVDLINKYGADALRMALIIGTSPGNDSKLSDDKVKGYKHFANKLWNITRFVASTTPPLAGSVPLSPDDEPLIAELNALAAEITRDLDAFRFYLAAEKLYHYAWHRFADEIIEVSKPILATGTVAEQASRRFVLRSILETLLPLLHPFMPFVTEEIWGILKPGHSPLIVQPWPADGITVS